MGVRKAKKARQAYITAPFPAHETLVISGGLLTSGTASSRCPMPSTLPLTDQALRWYAEELDGTFETWLVKPRSSLSQNSQIFASFLATIAGRMKQAQ